MPDIRVTDIYRVVDIYVDVAGEPDASQKTRDALADQIAEDLNAAGVYVEPS